MFDRINSFNMAPRMEYQGFSFDRPANPRWYLLQSQETYTDVTLWCDSADGSKTHTFYARVALGGLERQPETHEEFAELARSKGQQAPYEVKPIAYDQKLTTRQNQWCIRVEASDLVLGAPVAPDRELTMVTRGYRCLHPAWPKTTLDFFYSERGLANEIDPELSEEGEAFLDGVRIDVAPKTPAK
jgi:hypothetical protein